MELADKIRQKLNDYERTFNGASIEELLDYADWFSIYGYYVAEELANKKEAYNTYFFVRKSTINLKKQSLINDMSVAKATAIAEAEGVPALKEETANQSDAYRLELIWKQLQTIVSAIQQRVSHLKKEKNYNQNLT